MSVNLRIYMNVQLNINIIYDMKILEYENISICMIVKMSCHAYMNV